MFIVEAKQMGFELLLEFGQQRLKLWLVSERAAAGIWGYLCEWRTVVKLWRSLIALLAVNRSKLDFSNAEEWRARAARCDTSRPNQGPFSPLGIYT